MLINADDFKMVLTFITLKRNVFSIIQPNSGKVSIPGYIRKAWSNCYIWLNY